MKRVPVVSILLGCALTGAWASNPGEPLGCSDWVFLVPGFSCVMVEPYGCNKAACKAGPARQIDNEGDVLFIRSVYLGPLNCPLIGTDATNQTQLVRYDGSTEIILGYVQNRCGIPGTTEFVQPASSQFNESPVGIDGPLLMDPNNGRVLIPMRSGCRGGECTYPTEGLWLAAIEGFATTFEILQTYTPTADLGFRVPYMPEGFQFADYFDTYYGDLATVGDWSQAQPLQCGYPATPPGVGDYLTVSDPLPDPAIGQGWYYVTAVQREGETRYGRRSDGSVLSGRDPAVLPACN